MEDGKIIEVDMRKASDSWNLVDVYLGLFNRLPNEEPLAKYNGTKSLCGDYIAMYEIHPELIRTNDKWNDGFKKYLYLFCKDYLSRHK